MNLKEIVEIRDRLRGELETVEKFLEIARRMEPAKPDASISSESSLVDTRQLSMPKVIESPKYGTISAAIEEAIRVCPAQFTLRDVDGALEKLGNKLNRIQIATALTRYKESGRLKVVTERKGNIPAVYERGSMKSDLAA